MAIRDWIPFLPPTTEALMRRATEVRNLSASASIWASWRAAVSTSAGVGVDARSAATSPTVAAATRLLRSVGAAIPLHVFEPGPNGGSRRLANHPAERLINAAPNPQMTATTFRASLIDAVLMYGYSYSWVIRNGRADPIALFPLSSQTTRVEWQPDDSEIGGFAPHYKAQRVVGGWQQKLDLARDEVLAVVLQLSADGFTPVSPTETNRELFGLELALGEYGSRVFSSTVGGFGMVMKSSKPLGTPQTEEMRSQLTESHEGLTNSHRLAILGPDLTLERVAPVSKDLQNVEMRRAVRAFIAGTYGTPNLLLGGDVDQPIAKGQYNEVTLAFVTYALMPILKAVEQAMEQTLLFRAERERGVSIKHELRGLLRGSPDEESIVLARNVESGLMTPNEARELLDLPRIAGGDELVSAPGQDGAPVTRSYSKANRDLQSDAIIRIRSEQPLVIPAPIVNITNEVPAPVVNVTNEVPVPKVEVDARGPQGDVELEYDPPAKGGRLIGIKRKTKKADG